MASNQGGNKDAGSKQGSQEQEPQQQGGMLSLFGNDSTWQSMNDYMNQVSRNMDAMRRQMEQRMRASMQQMGQQMEQMGQQMNQAAIQNKSDESKDDSESHFHSFESHSFYDSNGTRVSHVRSHQKSSDGKESIKEEKRVGDQRRLTQKSRDNDGSEWKIEEKTENIKDDKQAMLDFEAAFDDIFSPKSDQKAIKGKEKEKDNDKK